MIPLQRANGSAAAVSASQHTADPRAAALAQRLGQRHDGSTRGGGAAASLNTEQADGLAELRRRVGSAVEVHLRPGTGTPRLIRGAVLQPAASGTGGGAAADADEATAREFLRRNRSVLRLDDPDRELVLTRREHDALGRRHLRFTQTYAGLAVWPAELVVHVDPAGNVDVMDGAYVATPHTLLQHPRVSAPAAIARARHAVPDGAAAEPGTPQLIIYAPGDRAPRLAWQVELSVSLAARWLVVIDGASGMPLTAYNQVTSENVVGSGLGVLGNTLPLNVFRSGSTLFMVDTSKQMFDPTSNPPAPGTTRGGIVVLDARNQQGDAQGRLSLSQVTSNDPNSWSVADAVSASFGLSETYDYYLERHARDSLDGQQGTMIGIVRFGQDFQNAFWNGTMMVFGDAQPFAGAFDVVAHELTHGVTQYSANLLYQNQAGAVNEAMSDIFGEMVEARTVGQPDWLKGAQLGNPFQNYINPAAIEFFPGRGYPARFSQLLAPNDPVLDNFQGRDNGGVHINSAIINHAYYLLAEGLDGGIGLVDAERIFYRALTLHLVNNSQFVDARLACITAADELFGRDSMQAQRTAQAFDAVEIVGDTPTPEPPPFLGVSGPDATLYVVFDPDSEAYILGRREPALGDGEVGVPLSRGSVAAERPSVVGDGSLAFFVSTDNDVCSIDTAGQDPETCFGFAGQISSVAVSPNGQLLGVILLDALGNPDNAINVLDLADESVRSFSLRAPGNDAQGLNTVLFADAMDFTADNRFLIYDALNEISIEDGSNMLLWSIFAIDLDTEQTLMVVPPMRGLDISFPALSQTSDNFVTFNVVDQQTNASKILAGNVTTGLLVEVADAGSGFASASYMGDDSAIIYSVSDDTPTGHSLQRQPLAADRITPSGTATQFLSDAVFGVIYRRGAFSGPVPGGCAGNCDRTGPVSTADLMRSLSVALGTAALGDCTAIDRDGNRTVTISELVTAVNAASSGCAD